MTIALLHAPCFLQQPQLTLELLQRIAQRIIPLSQWHVVCNLQVVDSKDQQQHCMRTTAWLLLLQ
jgi:hypothetical protein